MRAASTYRGAQRNAARKAHSLHAWRVNGSHAINANTIAKIDARAAMASAARHAVGKALVKAGPMAGPGVVIDALYTFYRNQPHPRSRVVNRITRDLAKQKRSLAA